MERIYQDITKGKIKSAYIETSFDKGKEELENIGYGIISLEKNALLRINKKKKKFIINSNGNWVKEGVIYIPKKGIFFTKNSPILENPKQATRAHKTEREYLITYEQVEKSLENSIQVPYNLKEIPTNRFGEDEITNFCFGKIAQDYGLFLKENNIKGMPICVDDEKYINRKRSSYANQLWFCSITKYNSNICGNDLSLGFWRTLRGILKSKSNQ